VRDPYHAKAKEKRDKEHSCKGYTMKHRSSPLLCPPA
jgi:hypothetical protein